jgi:hypothetical protein
MLVKGTIAPTCLTALLTALALSSIAVGSSGAGAGSHGSERAATAVGAEASAVKNFEETLRMQVTKKKGKRVAAKGRAAGTVSGKASFRSVLTNGSRASVTFFGHNSHGTISGTGVARYRINGAISSYNGKITGLEGTGRYARARSRGITFSGTVNRRTYDVKISLAGRWSV